MKNLLLFALLVASGILFFHDKQQSADLVREQAENAQLTQQLASYQTAFAALQDKARQLSAQAAAKAAAPALQAQRPGWNANTLQGSNPLDRPAYSR